VAKIQERYQKVKGVRAKFYQYSFLAAMDTSELSSGVVSFSKPGRMRWDYESPEKQVFLVKDGLLWFYQEAERQVVINDFKQALLSELPVAFLMGLGSLKNDFVLKDACRNAEGVVLSLSPVKKKQKSGENEASELMGFKLLVNPLDDFPVGAQVKHAGGNLTAILLGDVEFDPPLDASLFEPQFPKGTDINDLRLTLQEGE